MSKEPEEDWKVTIYHCTDGVVVRYEGGLDIIVEGGCLEEVAKLHGEDVWFLEFFDVNTEMLKNLAKSPFIQEAFEWLRSRSSGGDRHSYRKLLGIEAALKLDAVGRIGRKGHGYLDWRRDITFLSQEVTRIANDGSIFRPPGKGRWIPPAQLPVP